MIGIDTNVLVRYLVQDDEQQAAAAVEIFTNISDSNPAFISNIVMCELVWVLSRAYKYEKELILGVIEQLLTTADLEFENAELLRKALRRYSKGKGDFSDYLIAETNRANGASVTYTFDRKAGTDELFSIVS